MNSSPGWLSRLFSKARGEATNTGAAPGKVYLVSRSEYEAPLGHRVDEFAAAGLLEWFQRHWNSDELRKVVDGPASAPNYGKSGFWEVIQAMKGQRGGAPKNWDELRGFLESVPSEGRIKMGEGAIEALTDDDEIDLGWYLFDQAFAETHPERVACLLQRDWRLPEDAAEEDALCSGVKERLRNCGRPDDGRFVYAVFLSALDGQTIGDITGNCRFDGLHLPEFGAELAAGHPGKRWPAELLLLRALMQQTAGDSFAWRLSGPGPERLNERLTMARQASDFRSSKEEPGFLTGDAEACAQDWQRLAGEIKPENPASYWINQLSPPLLQLSPHLCQIVFQEVSRKRSEPAQVTSQRAWRWVFFDSRWMAANRDLALSLLWYGSGSGILSDLAK